MVTVLNTRGSQVCDAIVTATDGSYSARLTGPSGPPCPYIGAPERSGNYTVPVRLGPLSTTVPNVRVTRDQCHVHPQYPTITIG